ncbi:spermidine synthase [Paenibacillus spongiae]|uniref:Fused MFS/spermidine synthase n=1 Tax=Paenibacillus spongiae TaxID=2909671 RepID=A0ABY5S7C0_9BACL|nr:fused MFS/spermidine synthase [Paenibacillus spongiae]UVI29480.1 fused MFS/spermidine synthase [Paenibacillus spongiae]
MHVLARESSKYNEITIYEAGQLDGKLGKYRCMQFSDDAVQGAMDLNDPKRVVLEYPRAMIHLMEHNHSTFEHVFVIGHGIGAIAGHYSDKRFTVAEIDEKVVELSRIWFHYRQNNIAVGDGRQLLMHEEPRLYDYIIVDAFTKKGSPLHLTTLEFYAIAKEKLRPQGSILINLMGRIKNDRRINAIHTTLGETFAFTKVFALPAEEMSDIRNIIIMGNDKSIDFQPRAMAGFTEIQLDAGHIIRDRVSSLSCMNE